MMRIFLKVSLMVAACVVAVSCGNRNAGNSVGKTDTSYSSVLPGYCGIDTEDLKNLNEQNYIEFIKGIFGVDVSPLEGWKLYRAKSPNKSSNADVIYTCPGEIDTDALMRSLFSKCEKASGNKMFMVDMDLNTGELSRGLQFANYTAFKAAGAEMWYYDFNGKPILCSPNINSAEVSIIEFSFTLVKE